MNEAAIIAALGFITLIQTIAQKYLTKESDKKLAVHLNNGWRTHIRIAQADTESRLDDIEAHIKRLRKEIDMKLDRIDPHPPIRED